MIMALAKIPFKLKERDHKLFVVSEETNASEHPSNCVCVC